MFIKNRFSDRIKTKHMHTDCIEIRYDTIHIEFSISNFLTIRNISNFLYRILTRYNVQFRILYIEFQYSQKRVKSLKLKGEGETANKERDKRDERDGKKL